MKKDRFGGKAVLRGILGVGALFVLLSGITACSQIQPDLGGQTGAAQQAVSNPASSGTEKESARTAPSIAVSSHADKAGSGVASSTGGALISVVVSKEVDGDTIHVRMPDGSEKTIRMLLIDTPEDVKPNTPVEPFSLQAAAFARTELPVGKRILIEEGKPGHTLDKYGRLLAYVYITKRDMYNEDVVRKGLARVAYVYAPNTDHLSTLESDEQYAKSHKLGIWSLPGYVTSNGYSMAAVGSSHKTSTSTNTQSSTRASSTSSSTSSSSVQGGIKVVSSDLSVSEGDYASVTIQTAPYAHGSIEVDYKSGKSKASGLVSKNADGRGDITWEWKVGTGTTPGNWTVIITAGGRTIRLTLHVG